MKHAIRRPVVLSLFASALFIGCGPGEPKIELDPAEANKPFPSVKSQADTAKPKAVGFPGVKSAGDRRP